MIGHRASTRLADLRSASLRLVPRLRAEAIAALAVASCLTPCAAAESSWLKAIGGAWSDPARWSAGVPDGGDAVFGLGAGQRAFEVSASAPVSLASLTVTNQSPIFRFVTPVLNDLAISGAVDVFGESEPIWTIRECRAVTSGTVTIGGAGGGASLVLEGGAAGAGSLASLNSARIGDGGPGRVIVGSQGLLELGGPLGSTILTVVGSGVDGAGLIEVLPGGAITSAPQSWLSIGVSAGSGSLTLGAGSVLTLNGGTVWCGGDSTGPETAGSGTFVLDGGLITGAGAVTIGSEGSGTFVATGGTVSSTLEIGGQGGHGTLIVYATTDMGTVRCATTPSTAEVYVTGTGTQLNAGSMLLGQGNGGTAFMSVAPGTTVAAQQIQVGTAGEGTLSVEGDVVLSTILRLRSTFAGAAASALVDVHGPKATLTAPAIEFGPGDDARLRVRDGGSISAITVSGFSNPTSTVEVGDGGHLSIGSMVLPTGTLELAPDATASITSLTATGGRVRWRLGPDSLGSAPLQTTSLALGGPLAIDVEPGFAPSAGTDIPLAVAQGTLSENATKLEFEPLLGYPPLLLVQPHLLAVRVIDHVESFDLPTSVSLGQLPIEIPTVITAGGLTTDVSRSATWTFEPDGVVAQIDASTFIALAPGTATGTVHYGQASATVEFVVENFGIAPVELVSGTVTPGGLVFGNGDSYDTALFPTDLGVSRQSFAASGRYVLFASNASNLVDGDTNNGADVFVKDTASLLVERQSDGPGVDSGGESGAITPDGRFVAFASTEALLPVAIPVDGRKLYLRDRQTGALEFVSQPVASEEASGDSTQPLLSPDARYVAFESSLQFVPEDTTILTDVYLKDRETGTYERVSVGTNGAQLTSPSRLTGFAGESLEIAYIRPALGAWKVPFIYGIDSKTQEVALPGLTQPTPTILASDARLSADGRFVVVLSSGPGIVYDGPLATTAQLYRRDRLLGVTEAVSLTAAGDWANAPIEGMAMSDDGRFVAFVTKAPNFQAGGIGDGTARLYRKDLLTGVIEAYSVPDGSGNAVPFSASVMPEITISQDGRRVAFATEATNIIAGAPASTFQVYVMDRPIPPLGDLNGDFLVDPNDLALLLGDWAGSRYDLDGDGAVGPSDLAILLGAW